MRGAPVGELPADEQYAFIKALRGVGLHEAALEELDSFLARHPRHEEVDGALFMKAMSQHALRQNAACIATVKTLRARHPRSKWLPAASIYAIKTLRRSDNTTEIRKWVRWVTTTYPRHPKAVEARYNLGVYLLNVVSIQEGLQVLGQVIDEGGDHDNVTDARWKTAWAHRALADSRQAVTSLERLLSEHPDTGYRKAALYWSARFTAEWDEARAITLYQTCIEEFPHDYYGHQSVESLVALGQRPRQIGSLERFPDVDHLDDPAAGPQQGGSYREAFNLKTIGLYDFAAAEIASIDAVKETPSLQFTLADLHSRADDPSTAIEIVNKYFKRFVLSGSRDPSLVPREFWFVVYPYHHRTYIERSIKEAGLQGTGIEPYLIAALIRMESRFQPSAVSHVGAAGLMQVMPATADRIAEERGLPPPTRSELFEPETNIRFGTYYLAQGVREFQGDWFPAICAYNAGVAAARRWWESRPEGQPNDEFIENIPYRDTRLYLKQILGDFRNYEWLYTQG